MKRLFAAIKIHPSDVMLDILEDITSQLSGDKIRWVDPRNMHLTLKFFGETPEEEIDSIVGAIDEATEDCSSFELYLRDTGIFGSRYNPRVIWFGIEPNPLIDSLFHKMKNELEAIGYEYDRQNFVPHMTIGRIRQIRDKKYFQKIIDRFKSVEIQREVIDEVILYESILHREGPEYRIVETFPLK